MHVTMHIDEEWFHTKFPRVIGPYGSPSPTAGTTGRHNAMLWSHAYGSCMGYLRILWSRGCKIPYVYLTGSVRFTCGYPRGPRGFHSGMGTSVRSRADAVRAWEYPLDQWCRDLRGTARPASASLGYIYQAKHDYVTFDPLGPGILLSDLLWAGNCW